jgi:hypothetical protein
VLNGLSAARITRVICYYLLYLLKAYVFKINTIVTESSSSKVIMFQNPGIRPLSYGLS